MAKKSMTDIYFS